MLVDVMKANIHQQHEDAVVFLEAELHSDDISVDLTHLMDFRICAIYQHPINVPLSGTTLGCR